MDFLMDFSVIIDLISLICVGGAITVGGDATTWDGTVTGQDNLIIPELWSAAIFGYFEKALVLRGICDDYSALAKGKGDTINIPEIPLVTGQTDMTAGTMVIYGQEALVDTNLLLNKHKYVAKMLDDIGVIQANESLFSKYAQGMAYQLALQVDTDIMTELSDLGTTYQLATADNQITAADAESVVGTLLTNNLPLSECVWIVNPVIYADLLAQGLILGERAANIGMDFSAEGVRTGRVPSFFGMPVIQTSLIVQTTTANHQVGYCVHKGCVALAMQQDIRVQSEYSVDFLATKVVADCVYGVEKMTANKVMGVELLQN
tara:strand:+ start:206 stop:1162 length:957 start_codon:yes stop_codon:yes gene_type:complete